MITLLEWQPKRIAPAIPVTAGPCCLCLLVGDVAALVMYDAMIGSLAYQKQKTKQKKLCKIPNNSKLRELLYYCFLLYYVPKMCLAFILDYGSG